MITARAAERGCPVKRSVEDNERMKHNMKYRSESIGFSQVGVPDQEAHWYCGCNDWSFTARPNAARQTGNNYIEAQRAHGLHAQAHQLMVDDLAENYAEGLKIARQLNNG